MYTKASENHLATNSVLCAQPVSVDDLVFCPLQVHVTSAFVQRNTGIFNVKHSRDERNLLQPFFRSARLQSHSGKLVGYILSRLVITPAASHTTLAFISRKVVY